MLAVFAPRAAPGESFQTYALITVTVLTLEKRHDRPYTDRWQTPDCCNMQASCECTPSSLFWLHP